MDESQGTEAERIEESRALRERVAELESLVGSFFTEVLENSPVGVLILDASFGVVRVNKAIERFFSLPRAELLGKDMRQLISERIQYLFKDPRRFAEQVLAGYDETQSSAAHMIHLPAGESRPERWLEYHSQKVMSGPYAGGRFEYYYDVTSREGVRAALEESEAKYRSLVEQLPAVVYTAAVDQHVSTTYISPQINELLGFTQEEWLADPELWSKRLHPDDVERVLAEFENIRFDNDSPVVKEYRLITADGRTRWFRDTLKLVRDAAGRPLFFHGLLLDISDSRQAEEALRQSEARFRRLVESNIIGIMVADIYGKVTDANGAFLDMVGYTRDELPFRWDGMTPAEWRSLDEKAIEQVRWTGAAIPWEKEYIRKDGSRVPVLVGVSLLEDSNGDCICFVLDLSDRKRAEKALRRSERLASVGALAAGVAHEINNPVGGILMAAQYALKYQDDPDTVKTALKDVVDHATRCARIVKSVLKFAREGESKKSPADLNEVVGHSADLIRKLLENRGATLELELAEDLPHVLLDQTEIVQLIVSLVRNALQAEATRVVLRTRPSLDGVKLMVQDNGSGIAPEDLPCLFDPFFTTRNDQGGVGLGLSIAHGIVTDHGGEIEVESEPGQATTLVVRLPREGKPSRS